MHQILKSALDSAPTNRGSRVGVSLPAARHGKRILGPFEFWRQNEAEHSSTTDAMEARPSRTATFGPRILGLVLLSRVV